MSRYDDPDSPDYREHNQGGYDDSPEEKEIERLDTQVLRLRRELAAAEAKRREAVRKCAEICEQPSGQGKSSGLIDVGERCNTVLNDRARQIRAAFPECFP